MVWFFELKNERIELQKSLRLISHTWQHWLWISLRTAAQTVDLQDKSRLVWLFRCCILFDFVYLGIIKWTNRSVVLWTESFALWVRIFLCSLMRFFLLKRKKKNCISKIFQMFVVVFRHWASAELFVIDFWSFFVGCLRWSKLADMALTCRVQYLNDCDPFEYLTHYPEPPRPPVHTFSCTLPLVNQIAAVHRLLKAPHRVSFIHNFLTNGGL